MSPARVPAPNRRGQSAYNSRLTRVSTSIRAAAGGTAEATISAGRNHRLERKYVQSGMSFIACVSVWAENTTAVPPTESVTA